jgi:hypothetical protein
MAGNIYDQLNKRFAHICREHDLLDHPVQIKARALSTEEAIGDPEAEDFPLQQGKERLMQADFQGSPGQAFTDRFGDYEGLLRDILDMPLTNNYRRALFVATTNAVMRHLRLVDWTVHCRDKEPAECADELAGFIEREYGRPKITQIGFQPAMVEALHQKFPFRILDLDPDNIGTEKRGAIIEGPETTHDAIDWADLLLVTGTTIVNGTIDRFLTGKPVLFYGTTIAGAAELMNWNRFCARGK